MPRAKLQHRRARDLEDNEGIPDTSQRVRPGQADERREDHTGDRVRRADELQIGRRQAHALAVRDRAVQEHARRERPTTAASSDATAGSPENSRAPRRASAPAVMDEASAAPRASEPPALWNPVRLEGGVSAAPSPATASKTSDASKKIVSVSWCAARGTTRSGRRNAMTPKETASKTQERGPARRRPRRTSFQPRCSLVGAARREPPPSRASLPNAPAPRPARPGRGPWPRRRRARPAPTGRLLKSPTILVLADAASAINGAAESFAPSSAVSALPKGERARRGPYPTYVPPLLQRERAGGLSTNEDGQKGPAIKRSQMRASTPFLNASVAAAPRPVPVRPSTPKSSSWRCLVGKSRHHAHGPAGAQRRDLERGVLRAPRGPADVSMSVSRAR